MDKITHIFPMSAVKNKVLKSIISICWNIIAFYSVIVIIDNISFFSMIAVSALIAIRGERRMYNCQLLGFIHDGVLSEL